MSPWGHAVQYALVGIKENDNVTTNNDKKVNLYWLIVTRIFLDE
jgi:hypothetical protein